MMNKPQILKKIGNIIEELSEQQKYLATTSKINILELELFTANADFLIDHIEILKKLNERPEELPAHTNDSFNEKPVVGFDKPQELIHEPSENVEDKEEPRKFKFSFDEEPTEMIFDFEKKIGVEEVFDRPLSADEKRLLDEKTSAPDQGEELMVLPTEEEKEEKEVQQELQDEEGEEPFMMVKEENTKEPVVQSIVEKTRLDEDLSRKFPESEVNSVAEAAKLTPDVANAKLDDTPKPVVTGGGDLPTKNDSNKSERPLTLNEMLSAKLSQGAGNANQRSAKKLDDLKTAISINDKMVFIKELFNGYNLAYSEAIEIVNRFESFEAADNFLQKNYSVKNDWENKQITVARFYEYLEKKFVV